MTDSIVKDEEFLVQVQAQVMTRDDSSGGWVPMGGGGLSNVGLKRHIKNNGDDHKSEYLIYGERIGDKSVVLDCILKRDIIYTKANPKFHHWQTYNKRFGLTFERCDDAKAFDIGIQQAVADLVEGSKNGNCNIEGDEEVFAILDLPITRHDSSSQSASTTSTTTSSPIPQSPSSVVSGSQDPFHVHHSNHHHLHMVHYISTSPHHTHKPSSPPSEKSSSGKSDTLDNGRDDIWVRADEPSTISGKSDQGLLDESVHMQEYSYVIFAKNKNTHEYSYPTLEAVQKPILKREITCNVKKQLPIPSHPPLPKKKKDKKRTTGSQRLINHRFRCKHCHDYFTQDQNSRGSCEDAPDGVEKCIEYVTCVMCAKGLIYHCMSDPDGDYGHPCACDTSDNTNCKKWTALTILSFFVPCLWCYWPLMACHKCGVACGCCGGRHKAA